MTKGALDLHGAALAGLEFVLDAEGALLVNGRRVRATVADSVLDMCGAIVSITLKPANDMPVADLARWLDALRAEARTRENG